MKKTLFIFLTAILILLPASVWCELDQMNDIELKYVTGTEGSGFEEIEEDADVEQLEETLLAGLFELLPDYLRNQEIQMLYEEILRGLKEGSIELTNVELRQEGVSFDFVFDNFVSDKLYETKDIGFNKQYYNHYTIINGRVNHLTHN